MLLLTEEHYDDQSSRVETLSRCDRRFTYGNSLLWYPAVCSPQKSVKDCLLRLIKMNIGTLVLSSVVRRTDVQLSCKHTGGRTQLPNPRRMCTYCSSALSVASIGNARRLFKKLSKVSAGGRIDCCAPLGPGEARVRNGHVGASGIGCGVAAADPSTLAPARLALACWLSSMLLFFFRWSMS